MKQFLFGMWFMMTVALVCGVLVMGKPHADRYMAEQKAMKVAENVKQRDGLDKLVALNNTGKYDPKAPVLFTDELGE